jgi:hypothetical protein
MIVLECMSVMLAMSVFIGMVRVCFVRMMMPVVMAVAVIMAMVILVWMLVLMVMYWFISRAFALLAIEEHREFCPGDTVTLCPLHGESITGKVQPGKTLFQRFEGQPCVEKGTDNHIAGGAGPAVEVCSAHDGPFVRIDRFQSGMSPSTSGTTARA